MGEPDNPTYFGYPSDHFQVFQINFPVFVQTPVCKLHPVADVRFEAVIHGHNLVTRSNPGPGNPPTQILNPVQYGAPEFLIIIIRIPDNAKMCKYLVIPDIDQNL